MLLHKSNMHKSFKYLFSEISCICCRNIKCFLQRDSLSSAAHVFYVCRSSRNTYRRCYRSFQTRRQIEVKKVQVPDAQQNEPSLIKPFIFTVGVCMKYTYTTCAWTFICIFMILFIVMTFLYQSDITKNDYTFRLMT